MKQKTTLLTVAFALFAFLAIPMGMRGQSDYSTDYTGNITLSTTGGTSASACKVVINSTQYDGIKAGTSSVAGAMKITVPANSKYLHIHVAAWKNTTASLAVTPTGYSDDITLTANDGISSNSPFTFNGDPSTDDYYKVITFSSALTTDTELTFTAVGGKRFVIWGVTSEEAGGSIQNPSITANNVEIAYDATSGAIEYTVNNPVSGGVVTATTTSDWITLGTVSTTVPFTCAANTLASERTASVTLTYTYNTTQTVTKSVTVTQAGNPNVYNNISDITAAGTYTVQGTIVAKSTRGFIVGDGTGYIYYYNTSYSQSSYAIGDIVRLSGSVAAYGGVFEFNNTATVTTATTSNYVAEEPTVITGAEMDSRVASNTPTQLSNYVQYVGTLSVSGTYYNITNIDGATTAKGSISYPIDTDFTSLNGQEVVVKGYFVGISSSQYYNTMIGSVEENVVLNPQLSATPTSLTGFQYTFNAGPSQAQSFTVSGSDLSGDVSVAAPQDFEVSTTSDGTYAGSVTLTPTNGAVSVSVYVRMKSGLAVGSHTGNVTLSSGTLNATVALSGSVSDQPVTEAPVFTPAAGSFITTQNVSLSCTTDDATIYYTIDGTEPTTENLVYSTPITVSTTTTIKAMATASGYANSTVVEATYTIHEPITIAEARALDNDEYGCVEGTVTFIDNRNVYVQDITAGIVLFLNNNTVPSTLAIGDNVRAYGKRAAYNGLAELSNINGGNINEFIVLSSNNPLPLAEKTIAEINNDYSENNMLQSTRVKIVDAIIGAINTSGNTPITQDDNSLNIYRIPNVEGMIQGDRVTVTGIIGCYNAVQLRVADASDVLFEHRPVLTATPTTLNGFTYDYDEGGPSDIANFVLEGDYLVDIVNIIPSESFEVSTFGGNEFVAEDPSVVYIPSSGQFYDISIYVRMKAGLEAGTYNEQIAVASEDADTLFINVSGTVTGGTPTPPDPPTPGDGNYVRISDLNGLADGSYVVFAARFDSNATDYYAMTAASSGKPTGVLFTSATADENEVLPATIADEEATYYWVVGVTDNGYTFTNANGELIGYTSQTNFATGGDNTEWSIELSTAGDAAMVPGYTGFVINNFNNSDRCFALNTNHNFGPYSTQNLNSANYNFYLDLFVKTEGGDPPTPTAATPTFTPAAGTYNEAQTVSIACSTEGATIHYTIDGTTPSESSPVYSTPLNIEETTTVKAIAMKEGYNNSNVATATYTIQTGSGSVAIFNQDWEGEMNGWTFVNVEGEATWTISQNSGNHYAKMNGGSSTESYANEDWCISPAFNLDDYSDVALNFVTAMNYTGPDIEVFFSNDYDGEDPTAATWTPLTCAISPGSWTWTPSGNIDLSSFSGTNCYIGFKYISTDENAAAWEIDDIILTGQTSDPVVSVTPLTLTGFSYIEGDGPSAEQSFTVSGFNLSDDITITDATDFEISLASGDDFEAQSTITLTTTGGNVEATSIFVRMKAGLTVGEYNDEEITVTCDDVDDIEVTCSGTVSEQPVPGGDYVRISDASELVAGNKVILAARYNETANAYLAVANTLTNNKLGTTEFTSTMNGTDEVISADIMADEDSYYWTIDITSDGYTFTNANGQVLSYNSSTNFNFTGDKITWTIEAGTAGDNALVPNYLGFNITNTTQTDRVMALRVTDNNSVVGPYSISNINNSEYNFFLDIFMQGEGGTPTVAAPTFTPAAGTYYEVQEVTINCTTDGATIYFSTDSEDGPWNEYEEAITVDESMTLWAYAEKVGYNDSPVVSAEYVIQADVTIIFNQDWEEEEWHGWTQVSVEGDEAEWSIAEHSGNHYAYINGYNHGANEDWLISPAFDLNNYSDVVLTFSTAMNYTGPDIEVYFSSDYDGQDPTAATWQELECALSSGSWSWTESGEISLDGFSGDNCYIAFKYICTDDAAAAWEIDDIMLVSGSNTNPTLTATPNSINGLDYMVDNGPSNSQSYTLIGANLLGDGNITVTASENFEISLDDETFGETLEIAYADGQLDDQPVTIYVRLMEDLEIGAYTGSISHAGGDAFTEVSLTGTVHSEDEPAIAAAMPLYIQGNNGSNNNRVPVATAVYIINLEPSTTYRYTNQFVDDNDGPETAGAGNVIYANPEGFYRSTSPSLSTEGGYGEFTTDEDGDALVWFINEPTANARFTPGNHVYLRIRLNDGHDGTTVEQTFTTEDYATVLNFGTENDEYSGTAFYAKSEEASMTFAALYTDVNHMERPVYSTPIETTGIDYVNINQYADFYKELVAGKDGWFGGILPNVNETGINHIWVYDMDGYSVEYETVEGQWYPEASTINPNGGLDEPIFIDLTDDGVDEAIAANVKVWNTDHEFVIENSDNTHYSMTVYNVLGQPMMQHQINAGSTERISHSLATGVYVISLQNNQNSVAVKVIVR